MLTLLLQSTPERAGERRSEGEGIPILGMKEEEFLAALHFWQDSRQKRIDRIYDWASNVQNVVRLGQEEREEVEARARDVKVVMQGVSPPPPPPPPPPSSEDMDWLYFPRIGEEVRGWHGSRVTTARDAGK